MPCSQDMWKEKKKGKKTEPQQMTEQAFIIAYGWQIQFCNEMQSREASRVVQEVHNLY